MPKECTITILGECNEPSFIFYRRDKEFFLFFSPSFFSTANETQSLQNETIDDD